MDVLALVLSFILILAGAELFTNGIEWFGRKLDLAEGAVGSVLAAVGTALPETMIPVIAIVFGSGRHADEVGVGAVLGAPLMLSTLAMFVTGVVVLAAGRTGRAAAHLAAGFPADQMEVDTTVLLGDMRTFAVAYALAVGTAFLPAELAWPRQAMGLLLLVIYAAYVKSHFEADPGTDLDDIAPLRFHRLDRQAHRADPAIPRLRIANLQVVAALAFIVIGATVCVGAVPSAVTNNLNFGNPLKPPIYHQLREAVVGMAEACRLFETPVTGGNVSLFNETEGVAIYPTPVIGMVGTVDDVEKVCRFSFSRPGAAILLLGTNKGELGGSEYLYHFHQLVAGEPPQLDLLGERELQRAVLAMIDAGLVDSAHDCAEGGLAVALVEAAAIVYLLTWRPGWLMFLNQY